MGLSCEEIMLVAYFSHPEWVNIAETFTRTFTLMM
jgi:hypothetical protein